MIVKTGKEPHVEHLKIAVGTKQISFNTEETFGTIPLPELQRGGDVWIVRFGPAESTFTVYREEPKVSRRGMVADLSGMPDRYREDSLAYELEKIGAPRDVLIEYGRSRFDPEDPKAEVRVTFWEIES